MSKPQDYKSILDTIDILAKSPDGHLDKEFAKRCAEFCSEPKGLDLALKLLRDLLDECVFCAGASGLVIILLESVLDGYPEPDEEKASRRAELEKRYGM